MKKSILTPLLCLSLTLSAYGQTTFRVAGGHVVAKGQAHIVLQNANWVNDGNFSADSSIVTFSGTAFDTIAGSSQTTFHQLVLSKATGGVVLGNNQQVDDTLYFVVGTLDLAGNNLILGTQYGGISGETETNRVIGPSGGELIKTVDFSTPPNASNPGNLGAILSSSSSLGTTIVRRGHQPQALPNGSSIERYYVLEPNSNSGLGATLRLLYFDAELNGINEATLEAWQNEGTNWINYSPNATDASLNFVESLLDTLGTITLGTGGLKLSLKAYLQGPYAGGSMNDNLRSNNYIPLTEPYTALGYTQVNGGGETISADVLNVTGNDAIVDWVFLELRDKNNVSTVLRTTSALIQRDGDIVGLDGVSPLNFPEMPEDDYYLSLKHRNHLGIRTSGLLTVARIETPYDFSSGLAQAYDNPGILNNDAMVDLGGGVYGLFRGDVNQNGIINVVDVLISKSNVTPPQAGVYSAGDINLDGNISIVDFLISKSQSVPNKSTHQ
ncbi:MAG: dockerin type I domain-containing protein [Bacteroidota bacterium]